MHGESNRSENDRRWPLLLTAVGLLLAAGGIGLVLLGDSLDEGLDLTAGVVFRVVLLASAVAVGAGLLALSLQRRGN